MSQQVKVSIDGPSKTYMGIPCISTIYALIELKTHAGPYLDHSGCKLEFEQPTGEYSVLEAYVKYFYADSGEYVSNESIELTADQAAQLFAQALDKFESN